MTGVEHGPRKINKVMYISMAIHADILLCPAVFQVGFQSTLYRCTLCVPTGCLISYDETAYLNDEDTPYLTSTILLLEVTGPANYVLTKTDAINIREYDHVMSAADPTPELRPNPIANHFVLHHHRHLTDAELTMLTKPDAVDITLGSVITVQRILQQMMNRYNEAERNFPFIWICSIFTVQGAIFKILNILIRIFPQ